MFKKFALAATALSALTFTAQAADFSGKSWEDIVAEAKKEGEVNWYVWYFQDNFREFVKPFEEKYGIKVNIPTGTHDSNLDKMLADKARETGDIDVLAFGFDRVPDMDATKLFYPMRDLLPADDGRTWELVGIDGMGVVAAWWGNQTGIAYDPAKVDVSALPQTPEDFAKFWQENPGKFGFNYEKGGSGPSFYQNMLRVLTDVDFYDGEVTDAKVEGLQPGFDFFNKYAEDYIITASNVDSITRVSDGELSMTAAWEDHLAGLQKRGEVRKEIKFYIPEMGMNGGGNAIGIPVNAPHPAAGLVLSDWLASADVQSMFNKDFGTAPMHSKADDSYALVPNEQRKYRTPWGANPFRKKVEETFIENVVLER
ncbi:extracellular solute-binding protein [uncultured Cohaesibacter sp.]|uniref:extracellular solute-binding protein n=1 Tax=uncultured Cohaesibacter sp. TaxID=1002546 RepID=UPI00292F738E|nr:extracellular solute-binding protein [uncultured Cohaesibacter sp.]